MLFEPSVWGPHYWFFLHTVAECYPENPNEVLKRKYYDLIQNMPLFIPISEIGDKFSRMLDKYPVTPYLCSKQSFVRWMHFIHNKINVKLEKPKITLQEFYSQYYENYKPVTQQDVEYMKRKQQAIYACILVGLSAGIYYLYDK